MFVRPPTPAEKTTDATSAAVSAAPDPSGVKPESNNAVGEGRTCTIRGLGAEIATKGKVGGLIPNPHFTSTGASPVCMDPGRLMLYRSLGYLSGLAVRTGVPLPLSNLSPKWWMLVSKNTSCSSLDSSSAAENCHSSRVSNKATSRFACPSVTASSASPNLNEETTPSSAIEEVFASLGRLEEAGVAQQEIDEILADARFVAPLPNGQVAELLPGGETTCGCRLRPSDPFPSSA